MRNMLVAVLLLGGCAFGASVYAQAPAGAPSGSTGMCKDGTYTTGTNKRSACRGHKGVKDWYAAAAGSSAAGSSHSESKKSRSKKHAEEHESTSAEPTGTRPADATGLCKDGTYTTGTNKRSACRGHKGVKDWYAAAAGSSAAGSSHSESKKSRSKKHAEEHESASAEPSGVRPADATGLCKDGSYTTGTNKRSACRGHKGVKDWYGETAAKSSAPASPAPAAPSAPVAPMPSHQPAASPPMTMPPTHRPPEPAANQAPGGGPGMVWVNTESKVYHCQSSRWYGRTKQGKYMTEAQAEAQGFRAEHGKACG